MRIAYHPDESEIMRDARFLLKQTTAEAGHLPAPMAGPRDEVRRLRALRTCHRFALYERPRFPSPKESGAFIPDTAARIEDDRNLTDGARRCARKLIELTYRDSRKDRELVVTASYLARGLGRCRRTVQRYLGLLEREGYLEVGVIACGKTRMCAGLVVRLLAPLFPAHHKEKWPASPGNPDATRESQNKRFIDSLPKNRRRIARESWALRCMDGVFRSLMKTKPLSGLPPLLTG